MSKKDTRYLKRVVTMCICTVIIFGIGGYVSAWFDVNTTAVVAIVATALGGELILACVLRLNDEKWEKKSQKDKGDG